MDKHKVQPVIITGEFNEGNIRIEVYHEKNGACSPGAYIVDGIGAGRQIRSMERTSKHTYLTAPFGVEDTEALRFLLRSTQHPYPNERILQRVTESVCVIELLPTPEELKTGVYVEEKITLTQTEIEVYDTSGG